MGLKKPNYGAKETQLYGVKESPIKSHEHYLEVLSCHCTFDPYSNYKLYVVP